MPTKLNDCGCCEGITAIVPGRSLIGRGCRKSDTGLARRSIFCEARSPLSPIRSSALCAV